MSPRDASPVGNGRGGAGPVRKRRGDASPLRNGRRDAGSASVWLLAIGLVVVASGMAGAAVGAAHVASHRAQSAADLGALAGAARAIEGSDVACARAAALVSANGARLTDCRLEGLDLTVTVEVTAPAAGLGRAATATARAGPVRADEETR